MLWTLLYIQGEPHPLFGSDRLKMSHTLKVYGKKLLLTVLVKVLQRNRTSRIDVRIWEWCVYMGVVCVHGSGVCTWEWCVCVETETHRGRQRDLF